MRAVQSYVTAFLVLTPYSLYPETHTSIVFWLSYYLSRVLKLEHLWLPSLITTTTTITIPTSTVTTINTTTPSLPLALTP